MVLAKKATPKNSAKGKPAASKSPAVQKDIKKKDVKTKNRDEGLIKGDYDVDEDTRYTGTVANFVKAKGFGFIKPDKAGICPNDEVMVYWKEIQSDDRWPFLNKDMKVEFGLKKWTKQNGSGCFIKAKEVSLPGGERVSIQEEAEDKKEYVGGDKNLRYTGTVCWFDFRKGFGFVKIEDGFDVPEDMPTDLRIGRDEISAGEDAPRLRDGMAVEFGICKNKAGKYSCYNLTLPGGETVSRDTVDERVSLGDDVYSGKVVNFNGLNGTGWIETNMKELPKVAQEKIKESTAKRSKKSGKDRDELLFFSKRDCATREHRVEKDQDCTFKIYQDNRGVGAFDVSF